MMDQSAVITVSTLLPDTYKTGTQESVTTYKAEIAGEHAPTDTTEHCTQDSNSISFN